MNTKLSASLMRLGLILVVVLTALPEQTVQAAPIVRYARAGGLTSGSCTSWGTACELYHAMNTVAQSGDQVWVRQGLYLPTTTFDRFATFSLRNGVAIYGGFAGNETLLSKRDYNNNLTVLSGDIGTIALNTDNSHNVVTANSADGTAILDGFTITAGYAETDGVINSGAGVLVYTGAQPKLRNLVITGNTAKYGAGMTVMESSSPVLTNVTFISNISVVAEGVYGGGGGGMGVNHSTPVLNNVSFINNSAQIEGGGMLNENGADPRLTNVRFSGNRADGGGGMANEGSTPILIKVRFTGNRASGGGGGMLNESGSKPKLTDVVFAANRSDWGGGMSNRDSSAPILNRVTFSGNESTRFGGGMVNDLDSNPRLTNVTFNGNTAAIGGAIANINASSPILKYVTIFGNQAATTAGGILNDFQSNPQVLHSILWGNSGGQYVNHTNSTGVIKNSIYPSTTCPAGATCTNLINQAPKLAALANNGGFTQTMALQPGSPAIDRIFCLTGVATDQRGVARPQGLKCDIGAYELIH